MPPQVPARRGICVSLRGSSRTKKDSRAGRARRASWNSGPSKLIRGSITLSPAASFRSLAAPVSRRRPSTRSDP